jgi:hypothetical protein
MTLPQMSGGKSGLSLTTSEKQDDKNTVGKRNVRIYYAHFFYQ